jgi:uncharacterized protein
MMDRVNKILFHPEYQKKLKELEMLELERKFCKHSLEHFLDVARLAYIENLEKGLYIPKDLIYAASLLHDIGRVEEYKSGVDHEEASVLAAKELLPESGFTKEEEKQIIQAVSGHRDRGVRQTDDLAGILYRADKQSRICLNCKAFKECYWSAEKKNKILRY